MACLFIHEEAVYSPLFINQKAKMSNMQITINLVEKTHLCSCNIWPIFYSMSCYIFVRSNSNSQSN